MPKKLTVSLKRGNAMQVTRVSIGKKRLVYVIVTKNPLRYPWGRSRIAYIGTTKKGMIRIAHSIAIKSQEVLRLHGVRECFARILTCPPRPNVKTWAKLERALLIVFRHKYGALPKCNKQGKHIKARGEFAYFTRYRLEKLLEKVG